MIRHRRRHKPRIVIIIKEEILEFFDFIEFCEFFGVRLLVEQIQNVLVLQPKESITIRHNYGVICVDSLKELTVHIIGCASHETNIRTRLLVDLKKRQLTVI